MLKNAGELVAVDLHPLATQERQTTLGIHQCLPFRRCQFGPIEGRAGAKVEQRFQAETSVLYRRANAHADLRPQPAPVAPPVRDARNNAAAFQYRHFTQKGIGLGRRPGLRLKDGMTVEQRTRPGAVGRSRLHRFQQRAQGGLVVGAGILLKRTRQRQMHGFILRRQAMGIGGHERERRGRRALVLGEMEGHLAKQPQCRAYAVQPGLQPTPVARFMPGQCIEFLPQACEKSRRSILCARHSRHAQGKRGAEFRCGLAGCEVLVIVGHWRVCQCGQIGIGEVTPE